MGDDEVADTQKGAPREERLHFFTVGRKENYLKPRLYNVIFKMRT